MLLYEMSLISSVTFQEELAINGYNPMEQNLIQINKCFSISAVRKP